MKKIAPIRRALFAVASLLSISMADGAESPPQETRWNNPDRPPSPGLVHGNFHSASMAQEIGYNVYLPPGYEENSVHYPVVYFLHGAGGDENSDAGAFSGLVARLIQENKIEPLICVFPNGGKRSGYRDHPETKIMVETMIVKELLPLIDQTYRTRSSHDARVAVGFSMGGAGAVRFGIKYPDLFSVVGSWGGAFGGRDNRALPADFATDALASVAGRVRLLLVVGAKDFTLSSYPDLLRNLTEAKFPCAFQILSDVEHDPGAYYKRNGEDMLRFLSAGFKRR
jgi:endo-1,4-beta-xylanase